MDHTVPPDTTPPQADLNETPHVLLDPDADLVIRSRDSQMFRVLKLYIIRTSNVLGEIIQAVSDTSNTVNSGSASTRLPEIQIAAQSFLACSLSSFLYLPFSHQLSKKRWNFYQ